MIQSFTKFYGCRNNFVTNNCITMQLIKKHKYLKKGLIKSYILYILKQVILLVEDAKMLNQDLE